jgi:hypothetical protein
LFLTAFLLTLVVALCVAWLSVLPDGSYGCLEEMPLSYGYPDSIRYPFMAGWWFGTCFISHNI